MASAQECPTSVPLAPVTRPADAATPAASREGPTARVAKIRFVGNRAVGAGRLRRAMATKAMRLGRSAEATTWDSARWAEDHRRLCAVLRNEGYVTARVGPPEVADAPATAGPPSAASW